MRQVNKQTLDLIKGFEGCRLEAYQDSGGLWTIGTGHLIRPGESYPQRISVAQAGALLRADLASAIAAVERLCPPTLTDNQFGAIVSLVFNIGAGAFQTSTMLKRIKANDMRGAQAEFARWNKVHGKIVSGLVHRRAAESDLFATA